MNLSTQIQLSGTYLKNNGIENAEAAVVLGTGLNKLLKYINIRQTIPYSDIPHFPEATVEFHKGNLIYGQIGKTSVLVMQGRFHYYEGYTMQQITFPIRVMKALGVKSLFLSNAAGGMNPEYKKSDLVLIKDHINLQPESPLCGINDPESGKRFVDMSCPYDKFLSEKLKAESRKQGISVKEGTYVAVSGPNLEARAEYHYLRNIGADMVGMSTVPEVIVANEIGLPCAAVSVITDECDPDHLQPADINDIIATAKQADEKLSPLFAGIIGRQDK
ncbi:MAG: purine-nucleoside phosphorylase [Chitinophagaceae bacterium]|nr:MAG: purine-nucleoside phosphorylase [Chitinophagaceae bacterium]